jgi:hypothetical protein
MIPTQAEANHFLFPEDDSAACPADAQATHPSPAVGGDDARITANHVAWLLEASPAQGASMVFLPKVAFLMSAAQLKGSDRGTERVSEVDSLEGF